MANQYGGEYQGIDGMDDTGAPAGLAAAGYLRNALAAATGFAVLDEADLPFDMKSPEARQTEEDIEIADQDDERAFERGDFVVAFMIQAQKRAARRMQERADGEAEDGTLRLRHKHPEAFKMVCPEVFPVLCV